jgi:hypothetical protein
LNRRPWYRRSPRPWSARPARARAAVDRQHTVHRRPAKVDFRISQFLVAISRWCAKAPRPHLQSPGDFDDNCKENVRNWLIGRVKDARSRSFARCIPQRELGDEAKQPVERGVWNSPKIKESRGIVGSRKIQTPFFDGLLRSPGTWTPWERSSGRIENQGSWAAPIALGDVLVCEPRSAPQLGTRGLVVALRKTANLEAMEQPGGCHRADRLLAGRGAGHRRPV